VKHAVDEDFTQQIDQTQAAYEDLAKAAREVESRLGSLQRSTSKTGRISFAEIGKVEAAYHEAIDRFNEATQKIIRLANTWFE